MYLALLEGRPGLDDAPVEALWRLVGALPRFAVFCPPLPFTSSSRCRRRATLASGESSEKMSSSESSISFLSLDFMEYSLLRSLRSRSSPREGSSTRSDCLLEEPATSETLGVGFLLVPGVEYSLSEVPSRGVGADEMEGLVSLTETDLRGRPGPFFVTGVSTTSDLRGRPRPRFVVDGGSIAVVGSILGELFAELAADLRDGRPRGAMVAALEKFSE